MPPLEDVEAKNLIFSIVGGEKSFIIQCINKKKVLKTTIIWSSVIQYMFTGSFDY